MLTNHQRAGRLRAEKNRQIKMLCDRLDRHVEAGEALRSGKVRSEHLRIAAVTREELRLIDH